MAYNIYISGGSPTLSYNHITGNFAAVYGGGICIREATSTLDGNTIVGNETANNGGGIFIDDYVSLTMTNNLIARNCADSNGGGIYIDYLSTPSIINNTIVANNCGPNSWANEGIFMYNSPSPIIVNNIIAAHSSCIEGYPLTITLDYNLLWDCDTLYSGVVSGPHDLNDDPMFRGFDNGDYRLMPDSPAIDAASAAYAPSTDIENAPRPTGAGYDIGAYERCYNAYLPVIVRDIEF